jgi:hypothetical protein
LSQLSQMRLRKAFGVLKEKSRRGVILLDGQRLPAANASRRDGYAVTGLQPAAAPVTANKVQASKLGHPHVFTDPVASFRFH